MEGREVRTSYRVTAAGRKLKRDQLLMGQVPRAEEQVRSLPTGTGIAGLIEIEGWNGLSLLFLPFSLDPCSQHFHLPDSCSFQPIPNIEFRSAASPINGRNVNDLFVGILAANCPESGGCYCCTFPSPEEWMEKCATRKSDIFFRLLSW